MSLSEQQVAAVYQTYGHLVLRRCQTVLRNLSAGEDALQEVFVKVIKYGDSLEQAEVPLRWLYRVADRVCFDILDRQKRLPLGEESLPDESPRAIGDVANDAANRDVVLRLLARLDPKTRVVLMLFFVDGLSQERVAQETGWSRQTVNKKVALIRERARAFKAHEAP